MTFNDEVSSIRSETYVRSSSPSHHLLTSSYCSSSSWLYLLSWVRKHLITAALFKGGPSVSRGNRIFCHTVCLTVLLSSQVSASSLQTPLTRYVEPVVLSLFFLPCSFVCVFLASFCNDCHVSLSPQYFSTLENSLVSLFVLLTTAK